MVAESQESTVVSEWQSPDERKKEYQSEAELEKDFIALLQEQAYEYLPIHCEEDLIRNLRCRLEKLNDYKFSDGEWRRFFEQHLANRSEGIVEKTRTIQEDFIKNLQTDEGTTRNISLIDKQDIYNNSLQVINQYATSEGIHDNRYDVTILVNGLPLVHVELKRRGVDIREAFNQINRYQRESFWAGSGLYEFIQIFVISNGTFTKYYSNTTRDRHIKETAGKSSSRSSKKTSDSYEFTSWWADATNRPITDLMDFGRTFFAKHSLLSLLAKYCIFTADKALLVMRPYQIVATERILGRINMSNNYRTYGTVRGGGYIWHTTGSGKTLTSFKTAQLAAKLPYIDKVLFVVDRKDLDYQTMVEYDRFAKGCANGNSSTAILARQLESPNGVEIKMGSSTFTNRPIIITTIQKLSVYIKKNKGNPVFQKHVVIIFDECHRSQFGDMHTAVTRSFKRYHLFGFTGTPIFAASAGASGKPNLKTTEQAFGDKLHTYTIVDAITDKNVLPFRIDYVSTMKEEENIADEKVWNIDREKALMSSRRVSNIVAYILEHFDQKTKRNSFYQHKDRRVNGFNSIFATASIPACKLYYNEFKKQMADLTPDRRLKIATIFSFAPNEQDPDGFFDEENPEETGRLDKSSREFLESAVSDYNEMFKTSFDTSSDGFQNYYKDISKRVKSRELDLLIVVNMFLTGFDATTLNTLWVDKNLRLHGLLQAYSRTNRILNSIKSFGNIVCFRNLEKATNESIALFGDKEAGGIVLLRPYSDYYYGYNSDDGKRHEGYEEIVRELEDKYPVGEPIAGEEARKDFIRLYGTFLRASNILSTFDDFADERILSERDIQDYHSAYIDLYNEFRSKSKGESEDVSDDIIFEMELVKQVEINIDYILALIRKYHESHLQDKEIIVSIDKAVGSSMELRDKKDLIDRFIESLTPSSDVDNDWHDYIHSQRDAELQRIISDEKLKREETERFVADAFRDGHITETGTAITKLLPPMDPFSPDKQYTRKKAGVLEKLKAFFDRFFGL